ncbi:hypothetical protein A0K93_09065 [Corynebacterium sp. BCW_4722]|nr:hypothetical protein A0K93_09065 [Corynebacterium sp. BCW_4722]
MLDVPVKDVTSVDQTGLNPVIANDEEQSTGITVKFLTFDPKTGKITGTPQKAGTFTTQSESKGAGGKVLQTRDITFVIAEASKQAKPVEPKCLAASLGFGLPLIALIPIGLATQMAIPGLTPVVEELSVKLENANANIQRQLGIFNPQSAVRVAEINAQLRKVGLDVASVGAGLALIAAGILAGTLIFEVNCPPFVGLGI